MSKAGGRSWAGFAWAGLALAIFSGWFVVTRLVITSGLLTWDVVALRFGGGAAVLLPALLRQRLPWQAWLRGLPLAALWGAPFVLLVAAGLRLTSAADAASITPGLMPLFAGALGWAVLGERPAPRRLLGYALLLAGIAGLIVAGAGAAFDPVGLLCLVGAALTWAAYTVLLGRSGLTAIQAAALVCVWSAVLYLPGYVLSGVSHLPAAPWREIVFQLLYQGVLMSAFAILAFNRAVALLGPGAAAAVTALVPVGAAAIGIPVLGEAPLPGEWLAIALIAAGVGLAAAGRRSAAVPLASGAPSSDLMVGAGAAVGRPRE